MYRCFGMDRQRIRSSIPERLNPLFRLRDHEVDIKDSIDFAATQSLNEWWSKGQVRDKVSIHNIDVQPCAPGSKTAPGGIPKCGKVRRKQ
jgi:hypothetical protein